MVPGLLALLIVGHVVGSVERRPGRDYPTYDRGHYNGGYDPYGGHGRGYGYDGYGYSGYDYRYPSYDYGYRGYGDGY